MEKVMIAVIFITVCAFIKSSLRLSTISYTAFVAALSCIITSSRFCCPQLIGEYISALSNSTTLCGRTKGYFVWGIHDDTHEIIGTEFQYRKMRKVNEELEAWLLRMVFIEATGKNALLAPRIENQNNQFTKAVLFAKVPFEMTTKEDRVRTCYMQACLAYVNYEAVSNGDIRKLFGLSDQEMTKATRLIQNTIDAGLIKAVDPEMSYKQQKEP